MVGASVPDISLMPLALSCGHSSDRGAAGGSLVGAKLQQLLTRGAALKSCSEEQNPVPVALQTRADSVMSVSLPAKQL